MSDDLVFQARTEAGAVHKACHKLMVEPRMLRYEVLIERRESKRRLNHLTPFCRIRVVDVVWPADYQEIEPEHHKSASETTSTHAVEQIANAITVERPAPTQTRSPSRQQEQPSSKSRPERMYAVSNKTIPDLTNDFVSGLLHKMGFDSTVRIEDLGHAIRCNIAPTHELMKTWHGEGNTLESIGYLANRYVGRFEGNKPVFVNLDNTAEDRDIVLVNLAKRIGTKAITLGKVIRIYPMSSPDRKTIHTGVSELEGVRSESEGSGAFRRLLIIPTSNNSSVPLAENE